MHHECGNDQQQKKWKDDHEANEINDGLHTEIPFNISAKRPVSPAPPSGNNIEASTPGR
jgi:hypothetical protein